MNKITIAAIAVVFILASGSAISLASSGNINGAITTKTIDGYSVSYNSTSGFIKDVSYEYMTGGHVTLASGIYVNGTQINTNMFLKNEISLDSGRVVIFGNNVPQSIGIMTGSTGHSNMDIHLNESARVLQSNFRLSSSSQFQFGGMGMKTYSGMQFRSYEIMNGNFSGVIVTDGKVSLTGSNSNTVMSIEQVNSTFMEKITPLFAVFVTSQNIQNLLQNHKNQLLSNKFAYNATTGKVVGKYVSFQFNNSTNTVSNMNLTSHSINSTLFSSVKISGNGTIGKGFNIPSFKIGSVDTYGSIFFYANDTYIMTVHDNPVAQSSYIVNNGTIIFSLPDHSNVSMLRMNGFDTRVNESMVLSGSSFQEREMFGLNNRVSFGTEVLKINTPNVTEMMVVNGGNITVKNNSTITVKTGKYAMINVVVPPGLHNLGKYEKRLDNALSSGKIAAELSINGNTNSQNFTMSFNSTVITNITSISSGHAIISVSALPGHKQGTNVVIFLSNTFLQNSHNVYIKFDGTVISSMSMNGLLNDTSSVSAAYSVYAESNGDLVIMHIPHFSNHTIEVSNTEFPSTTATVSSLLIPVIGVVIAAAVIVGAVVFIRKRNN
ncbi:MAG: hypothetical protein RE472_05145 [Thermoplasmatales archaeon]|jgi:hypothetical protein|nr:MAG: hypothetical protein AMDU5_GPLC00004G0192 [Thermoplasmatales archaeon Gpl]WMT48464.1 MAG: hypothetical protein RE472_05145 [Thermoplasmatales archaeon]